MSDDPFKYITREDLKKVHSPILFFITEEEIQSFAEDNYPPRLSGEELRELVQSWAFVIYGDINDLMYEAIRGIREENK